MKIQELIEELKKRDPNERVCAIYYTKELFDFEEYDNLYLSDEKWEKVCDQFEAEFHMAGEWIAESVLEHSDIVKELF